MGLKNSTSLTVAVVRRKRGFVLSVHELNIPKGSYLFPVRDKNYICTFTITALYSYIHTIKEHTDEIYN